MDAIAASTLSWQSLSEKNVALRTLSSTTRSRKIIGGASSNSLSLSDGPASFSIQTNFNSRNKLRISPDLESSNRLLSRFPSIRMLSETFLNLRAERILRCWFGLVNQPVNYAQLRNLLQSFKPYLSPKRKFERSDKLDEAFFTWKKSNHRGYNT